MPTLSLHLTATASPPNGGDEAFERLKMIVQMAQSSGEGGWKAFEDKKEPFGSAWRVHGTFDLGHTFAAVQLSPQRA